MKKRIKIILIILGIIIGILLIDILQAKLFNNKSILKIFESDSLVNSAKIPNDYIAIFHGGSGEIVYETYIYKIANGKENQGFKFINVTKTTTSYGSSKWNTKVTKQGDINWTDDVFEVAKQNNAYSFVTLPNSDKIYKIEEYQKMFFMD